MRRIDQVIEAIKGTCNPDDALRVLKMKPSRLMRVLNSPTFKARMELRNRLAQHIINRTAGQYASWLMGMLANMANCNDSDTARKAYVIALANAVGSKPVMPGIPRRKSNLDEMAALVLRLAEKAAGNAPDPGTPIS
jgi:hypothetical protein